tara:strand:- start:13031 stop:13390 length:360 start_codon:yes stop_codon:yes gene_type:complete
MDHIVNELNRIAQSLDKTASQEGPIEEVLLEVWNQIHDIESRLTQAVDEWERTLSYSRGRKEDRNIKALVKEGRALSKALDDIASKRFEKFLNQERKLVAETGRPYAYSDARRSEIFPR